MTSHPSVTDKFHIPCAPDRTKPARTGIISTKLPSAKSAMDKILQSTDKIRYGRPISEVLNNYRFVPESHVTQYHNVYLYERFGYHPSSEEVDRRKSQTINTKISHFDDNEFLTDRLFQSAFNIIISEVDQYEATKTPSVRFIIGETGSGKSAFSRAIFTNCLQKFWDKKIIPTRVEYSKFNFKGTDIYDIQDFNLDISNVLEYIKCCQLRDLFIYLFYSRNVNYEYILNKFAECDLDNSIVNKLIVALDETKDIIYDGELNFLDSNNRHYIDQLLYEMGCCRSDVLYELSKKFKIKYMISLDGFDSTRIDHFLFEHYTNRPVAILLRLLRALREKGAQNIMPPTESHYILYLRSTTYESVNAQIMSKVSDYHEYPVNWIVPPTYDMLVHNASIQMTGNFDQLSNGSKVFSDGITDKFRKSLVSYTDNYNSFDIRFLFGSNGRRMKRHIRQTAISIIIKILNAEDSIFKDRSSGISPRDLWLSLANSGYINSLPNYSVIEDLFLNESRQLLPKLEVKSSLITQILNSDINSKEKYESIINTNCVIDVDENGNVFGCMLNYFYRSAINRGAKSYPALLLLIRIIQFIKISRDNNSHNITGDEIYHFINNIGYAADRDAVYFCISVILRSELVKWNGSTGTTSLGDIQLYVSTKGLFAIDKILYSITYLSESILCSLHLDRNLSKYLRQRHDETSLWIVDCILNANIAVYIIDCIEKSECEKANSNSINFSPYKISEKLFEKLSIESSRILNSAVRVNDLTMKKRWNENYDMLCKFKNENPEFVIFSGVTSI